MKKIAILTSSRVSAGMNTILYYLLKSCYNNNIQTYGIQEGFNGLINNQVIPLSFKDHIDIINIGGTILKTGDPRDLMDEDNLTKIVHHYQQHQFDCLIVIGGHGSYNITRRLIQKGISSINIPCTLDNDYSVGYHSALNTLMTMVDRLNDTSSSHEKCTIIKVEGCSNNKLIKDLCHSVDALYVDNATLSKPITLLKKLETCHDTSSNALICLSATFDQGDKLKTFIEEHSDFEVRYNDIAFVYRGGSPCAIDRLYARDYAYKAIDLYNHHHYNKHLKMKNNKVIAENIR